MARREVLTVVPNLVGLGLRAAQDVALDAQLLAVDADPADHAGAAGVVAAQAPGPGCYLPPGSPVCIWVPTDRGGPEGRDGGGGARLPTGPVTVTPAGTKPR
ncbi:PASTA domain-containing protein [Pseudonocardia eucalypti]